MWMCASGSLEADFFLFCHFVSSVPLLLRWEQDLSWDPDISTMHNPSEHYSQPYCVLPLPGFLSPLLLQLSLTLCFYLGPVDNLWPAFVVSSSPDITGGGVSRLIALAHIWPLLNLFEAELKAPRGVCLYQNDNAYNAQKMLNTSCLWNLRQGFVLSWSLWFLCTSAKWLRHWGWQHYVSLLPNRLYGFGLGYMLYR